MEAYRRQNGGKLSLTSDWQMSICGEQCHPAVVIVLMPIDTSAIIMATFNGRACASILKNYFLVVKVVECGGSPVTSGARPAVVSSLLLNSDKILDDEVEYRPSHSTK